MNAISSVYIRLSAVTLRATILMGMLFFSLVAAATESNTPLTTSAPAINTENAEHEVAKADEKLNPSKVILDHVLDGYSYHFFDYNGHAVGIDLPIILYSVDRGWSFFSSARFNHGHDVYEGYKMEGNKIFAVDANGSIDRSVPVVNLSISRNVLQLLLACLVCVLVVVYVSAVYKRMAKTRAVQPPQGLQNAIETVIVFIRDEVAKPNLGKKVYTYLPFLLSVFFFILINNLFGLIPGSANVTGNITFTLILSMISFLLMLANSNKAFWLHLAWPPGVPFLVKIILIPVEFLGIFVKPFALMIRLFANMLAGHIILLCFVLTICIMASLSVVVGWSFSPVALAFMVFIYIIEILVAFIQAYIFTTLASVFIGQMSLADDHH